MSRSRKSSKRETYYSSDDSSSEKILSKNRYSGNSDTSRKSESLKISEKHKKNKKSSKDRPESSPGSDGGYDSRKENKSAKRHRKEKPLIESYEKLKDFKGSGRIDRFVDEQNNYEKRHRERRHKVDDEFKDNLSPERETRDSKNSRKRSRSQEKQRYGKWTDISEKNKDSYSKTDNGYRRKDSGDEDYNSSRYHKRSKRNWTPDSYKHFSQKDLQENDKNVDYNNSVSKKKYGNNDVIDENRERESYNAEDLFSRSRNRSKNYDKDTKDYDDRNETNYSNFADEGRENKRYGGRADDDCGGPSNEEKEAAKKENDVEPLSKRAKIENINMRTGGAYIPPAKLRMMQESIQDKGSEEYQRIAWEALKKSIMGMTNKVNSSNIGEIVQELFKENIIRGRGVLARAIMQAQAASPTFTRVYAALAAVINSKFPEIGELLIKRLIIQYKRGFRRNDKTFCMTAARFLAHLFNQEVAHEILILEMVTHLLENATEDSVEIAISALKECGKKLEQLSPRGMRAIAQRVRDVLHEGSLDMRVRYLIEVFFAIRRDNYKEFETIEKELDLLDEEDKYTHLLNLDDAIDGQDMLNVFKFDPDYIENEEKYKSVAKEILGDSDEEGGESEDESGSEEENDEEKNEENQEIIDKTETNIVCLRRKIYLTIQSSLDFEECAHKLLRLELKPGQILEMCYMILDCCAQQRTYEKFFGLLAQRFCQLNKVYVEPFTEIFENSYKTIHRLETNKLRNVAKFFAHLLYTDAISWNVLAIIKLNEEDTTSSSRIFIKILFQELCEYMGLTKLNERVKDVTLQEAFDGLFPRDHPHNTRFAINFFTSIGLGGLTDELREHLKNLPKNPIIPVVQEEEKVSSSSASSSSSSSASSSSSSSSSSESD